jgi:hypothetical protein
LGQVEMNPGGKSWLPAELSSEFIEMLAELAVV